jgi:hypothetical protein
LRSFPAGSTLQSATLSLNVTGTTTDVFEIYELKRNWSETQATWKKANSSTNWQSAGAKGTLDRGTTVLGTVTPSATGIRNITLNAAGLAVVQKWINNPATNFGFIIQDYANASDDDLIFSSKESALTANRPQLQVVYAPPSMASMTQGSAMSSQAGAGRVSEFAPQPVGFSAGGNDAPIAKRNQGVAIPATKTAASSINLLDTSFQSKTSTIDTSGTPVRRAAIFDAALTEMQSPGWPKIVDEILPAIR